MYNLNLHFHFIGVGGSGMSGLAEILVRSGFKVSGSDLTVSDTCRRLESLGVSISRGHSEKNLPESCSLVVYSSAVKLSNPEMQEARRREIPCVRRAEVLAELMRLKFGVAVAGSHGKTTTTSLVSAILEHAGLDPTVIIGGQVKSIGSGGKLGKGDFLVAETDESDRSFLLMKPTIAIVTNVDAEHLEAYQSFADLEDSFRQFIEAVPFYGLAVLCADDPRVRDLAKRYRGRKVTYGVSPDATIRAENITCHHATVSCDVLRDGQLLFPLTIPVPGRHILVNSLAAIAVGLEFGVAPEKIRAALEQFSGVGRRLEILGSSQGILVMNDYGHHPTEVRATIAAVRAGWKNDLRKLHVIFQPHRYSRTKNCFAEFLSAFNEADRLLMTEIYSAGEDPIEGICGSALCEAVSHPDKRFLADLENLPNDFLNNFQTGDVIICLGAGSVGAFAPKLLALLREREAGKIAA